MTRRGTETQAPRPRGPAPGRRLTILGLCLAAILLSGGAGWLLGAQLGAAGWPALAPLLFPRGALVAGLLAGLLGLWLLRRLR
jgi:hypothetical protein